MPKGYAIGNKSICGGGGSPWLKPDSSDADAEAPSDDEDYLTGDKSEYAPRHDDDYDRDPAPTRSRRRMEPHRGTLILVLGILSITFCQLCGPFAWMLGNEDLRKMRAGRMDPSGEGNTNAGRILGIIGTVLMIGVVLIWLLFFVLFAASVGSSTSIDAPETSPTAPR